MQNKSHGQHGLLNGALSSDRSSGWQPPLQCLCRAIEAGGSPGCDSRRTGRPGTCHMQHSLDLGHVHTAGFSGVDLFFTPLCDPDVIDLIFSVSQI